MAPATPEAVPKSWLHPHRKRSRSHGSTHTGAVPGLSHGSRPVKGMASAMPQNTAQDGASGPEEPLPPKVIQTEQSRHEHGLNHTRATLIAIAPAHPEAVPLKAWLQPCHRTPPRDGASALESGTLKLTHTGAVPRAAAPATPEAVPLRPWLQPHRSSPEDHSSSDPEAVPLRAWLQPCHRTPPRTGLQPLRNRFRQIPRPGQSR